MNGLERQVAAELRRSADAHQPPDAATLAARAISTGRRVKRRRMAVVTGISAIGAAGLAATALALAPSGGSGEAMTPGEVTTSAAPAPSVSDPARQPNTPPPADSGREVTRCADIKDSELPRDTSYDTSLDTSRGLLTLHYSYAGNPNTTLVVAYRTDPTCKSPSRIEELIRHALAAAG